MSETPCFTVFSSGRPLNLGGEIVTPKCGGGKHGPIWQKPASPLFIGFFSLLRQKTWPLARMKTGIFSFFGCHQVTVKIRVWEQCPKKHGKMPNRTDFAHIHPPNLGGMG